ncbi:MAG: thioredoxin domain-containing protein [Candidatus Thermoplasmatota archaeon]|nr:thioredoxin domain-containing protein [Candidatus Thermoplasmatota archaeon]
MGSKKKPNHLFNETSPYLQQHVYNPVDWYPWSEQAFNKAKKEHKPVFLSIGYATCHWCHVMAHESFEDETVATLLNDIFVCIKVDREERPDIDMIYMKAAQMINGAGGWPLTVFLTPDKKPFFAATYIPKTSRYGMKGLLTLLPEIKKIWDEKYDELLFTADQLTTHLIEPVKKNQAVDLDQSTLKQAYQQLVKSYDKDHGGFGNQQKFPMPHSLLFLLRYWKRTSLEDCLTMVTTTLEKMRMGGIYDQIGFGFHRYATDNAWRIPHFEKMLYDQALLLMAYTEAYQTTKNELFKQTAQEIITYVLRDMTSANQGFYSAEDADSEGMEGVYYMWTYDELKQVLTNEELDLMVQFYDMRKEGNIPAFHGLAEKKNILYQPINVVSFCRSHSISEKHLRFTLEEIRKKLFFIREKRIHPEKDDKILTDWNGLFIAALAKAGVVFNEHEYLERAEQAVRFIVNTMMDEKNRLFHNYRNNKATIQAYANDYAFLIWGLIELYQATFKPEYLKLSVYLSNYFIDHFYDKTNGGFFFTSDTNENILIRTKEIYDGAVPSANSVALYNLIRLSRLTKNTYFEEIASEICKTFSSQITTMPNGYTQMMIGLDFAIGPSYEIIIVGNKDEKDTQDIINQVSSLYLPRKVVILKEPGSKTSRIEYLLPYMKAYEQKDNKATMYICINHQCQLPTNDIEEMKQLLNH